METLIHIVPLDLTLMVAIFCFFFGFLINSLRTPSPFPLVPSPLPALVIGLTLFLGFFAGATQTVNHWNRQVVEKHGWSGEKAEILADMGKDLLLHWRDLRGTEKGCRGTREKVRLKVMIHPGPLTTGEIVDLRACSDNDLDLDRTTNALKNWRDLVTRRIDLEQSPFFQPLPPGKSSKDEVRADPNAVL